MYDVTGTTALVTGAARRLGKHIALALAREGANVFVHYNTSETEARDTADLIQETGVNAWPVRADLSAGEGVSQLIAGCSGRTIDILINSASIFPEGTIFESSYTDFLANLQVNALAPLELCRWFAGQAPGRIGSIVNLLDARIVDYDKNHVPYHLSKQALASLTRMLSIELAPGIRVNGVAPGLILPPEGQNEEYLENLASTNPLQTWGNSDDISEAVLYLIKAPFVTGNTIYVDGGRHIHGRFYGS